MGVEERLKDYLDRKAREADLPPRLFPAIHRRARRSRFVTAATLGAVLVAASVGGLVVARSLLRTPQTRPVAPQPSLTPIPEAGDGVEAQGPGVVITRGVVDGEPWALVAYRSTDGLCVDVQLDRGGGGGCGFDVPGRRHLGVSRGSQMGFDRDIIHGVVSEGVAALEWRPAEGAAVPIEILLDPAGFGVNFFVTFVPRDALGALVALDGEGRVLEEQRMRTFPDEAPACCQEDVIDDHKVTVYYPLDWQRAPGTLTPRTLNASEIVSLGTSALEPGSNECPGIPEQALEGLGPADSLVTIQEVFTDGTFGPLPKRFSMQQGVVPDDASCLENGDRIVLRRFSFSDESRAFRAYVAFGERASRETQEEAMAILNSFLICDPSSKPGDCL